MGSSLNKVMLIGNLGQDPELRYTSGNLAVATLSIATDESYTPKGGGDRVEKTEWHKVVVWGKQAENAEKYLRKGSTVFVEASLQTKKWQDRNGKDRWTTEIKAFVVKYLSKWGNKSEGSEGRGSSSAARDDGGGDRPSGSQGGGKKGGSSRSGETLDTGFSDDDIPFRYREYVPPLSGLE